MAKYEIKDGVGIIPEGTTAILPKAFDAWMYSECEKDLKKVSIPDSVTGAIFECAGFNHFHGVGYNNTFQFFTISECTISNLLFSSRNDTHSVFYFKISHRSVNDYLYIVRFYKSA